MNRHAEGSFDVTLNPEPADATGLGRLALDKRYHGDLEATAQGHMLSAMTALPAMSLSSGSAGRSLAGRAASSSSTTA